MEAITIHQGKMVPLLNDNIDTDQIIPKKFLKRIEKTGFGIHLFDEWRYLENGENNPEFILNQPIYQGASILLSGNNFGCGSSREHAAWALMDYGFKVIIAGSYSDIFYMNALKNGLLPIVLPNEDRAILAKTSAEEIIEIDLPNQKIKTASQVFSFEIDQNWKGKLVNGLDEIGLTLQDEDLIEAYESKIPSYWQ